MIEKKATMFYDFIITPYEKNNAVKLVMSNPLEITAKIDNLATSMTLQDNLGLEDYYGYKYITFDGKNVHEITNAIRNGNIWTFSLQYLSEFLFDSKDFSRYVSGVSVKKLQNLGLNISDFFGIVGNQLHVKQTDISASFFSKPRPFMYAVKIKYSELPQNLNQYVDQSGIGETSRVGEILSPTVSRRITRNAAVDSSSTAPNPQNFTQFDESINVIVPIPLTLNGDEFSCILKSDQNRSFRIFFKMATFIETLAALISELTLSVELTVIGQKTLVVASALQADSTPKTNYISFSNNTLTIKINDNAGEMIRVFRGNTSATAETYQPCFVMKKAYHSWAGLYEIYDYIKIPLPECEVNEARTNLVFLGNDIDISNIRNDYFFIQRLESGLRIHLDLLRNDYVDIATSIEFDKNAYSNYIAYKQANLQLSQAQEQKQIRLQRGQQFFQFQTDSAFAELSATGDAIGKVIEGDYDGAISGAINYRFNSIQNAINFANKQAFVEQNLKLKQSHQRTAELRTIVPSSQLNGSQTLISAFATLQRSSVGTTLYSVKSVVLSDTQMRVLEKYMLDNDIMDGVQSIADIAFPEWQTMRTIGGEKIRIENTYPALTRPAVVVYGKAPYVHYAPAEDMTLIKGIQALPALTIRGDSFAVTDIVGNQNATASFEVQLPKNTTYRIVAFVNPLPTLGSVPFDSFFSMSINGELRPTNGSIPRYDGKNDRESVFVPVSLGTFSLPVAVSLAIFGTNASYSYKVNLKGVAIIQDDQ